MTPRASISLAHGIQHGSSASAPAGAGGSSAMPGADASTSPHISNMYRIIASSSSGHVGSTTNANPGKGHHAAAASRPTEANPIVASAGDPNSNDDAVSLPEIVTREEWLVARQKARRAPAHRVARHLVCRALAGAVQQA